jgi:hypothetical protein
MAGRSRILGWNVYTVTAAVSGLAVGVHLAFRGPDLWTVVTFMAAALLTDLGFTLTERRRRKKADTVPCRPSSGIRGWLSWRWPKPISQGCGLRTRQAAAPATRKTPSGTSRTPRSGYPGSAPEPTRSTAGPRPSQPGTFSVPTAHM